jgi:hypothetical protein
MSGWGTGWYNSKALTDKVNEEFNKHFPITPEILGVKQEGQATVYDKKYSNLKPTHDPHTNPNAHIYYECKCGAILDPGTKSFAALNNYASEAGWKVRWGADSYVPYCVKCGEDVE